MSLALGLAIAAALWAALTITSGGTTQPTKAPSFAVPRLGGGPRVTFPVVSDGANAPVVLTFFASWCTSCRSELPMVAAVAKSAARAGSPVVFLGVDDNDAASSGLAFARRSGVGFAVGEDFHAQVGGAFQLDGMPDTVFISATGDVLATVRGPVSRSTLQHWLRTLAA